MSDEHEEDDIDITTMELDELYELMHEDLYDGYAEEIEEEVHECLSRGITPYDVLTDGLVAGMENGVAVGGAVRRVFRIGLLAARRPCVSFHGH